MTETKETKFKEQVMEKTGGLVIVTKKNFVIIPTNVGQTKEYCLESFRRDYSTPEAGAVNRVLAFLLKADIATKKYNGKLGFLNRCLPDVAEVLVFNLRARRRSEGFYIDRVLIKYDQFKNDRSRSKFLFPSFFSKKPRK